MGFGLHLYSLSTRFQAARTSYSTASEYICEAICEEGFFLAQKSFNSPDEKIKSPSGKTLSVYESIRNPQQGTFSIDFKPERVIKHLQKEYYDEMAVNFPVDGIKGNIIVMFDGPFSNLPNQRHEYSGTIIIESSVAPTWSSGNKAFRKMTVSRKFKVIAITPPHPFDKSALTIINPDYINGKSKQKMNKEIFEPVNKGIDEHNQLCKIYKKLYDQANKSCTICSQCSGSVQYVSGSPKFFTPTINNTAKISPDFFDDKSLITGNFNQDSFDKLVDFNYEDILFDLFPPLYKFFKSVITLSKLNATVLAITSTLLAIVPGQEIYTALESFPITAAIGAIIEAIHTALEVIVPIQFIIGQITVIVQKIIMEGHIIGQFFEAINEASKGNFKPAASGAANFVGNLNSSGILEDMGSTTEGLNGINSETENQDFTEGVIQEGEDGATSINDDALSSSIDKYGDTASYDDNALDGQFDSLTSLEGMDQNILGAGDSLTKMFGGKSNDMGAFGDMASDSKMAALTGLIKGFVKNHRKRYLAEHTPGTTLYAPYNQYFMAFDKELWKAKATFITKDAAEVKAIFKKYKKSGLCGIICHLGSDKLTINANRFKGKLIVFSTTDIDVRKCTMENKKRDSITLVSEGTIKLSSGKIQASLNATGEKNSYIEFKSPKQSITGNILLNSYSVKAQDNRKSNKTALKGKLALNKRLNQRKKNPSEIKESHFRVIINPSVFSQEVKMR